MLTLRLGSTWAQEIGNGRVEGLEVQHKWASSGSGLNYVKWSMDLPERFWHPSLAAGTIVEVFRGDVKLGAATISEVDRADWTFVADGIFRQAEKYNATQPENIVEVIEQAIARGMPWAGIGELDGSGDPYLAATRGEKPTIASMLTGYVEQSGQRWGVDENDLVFIKSDPFVHDVEILTKTPGEDGTPQWAVTPGTPLMPFSDDLFVTRAHVLYHVAGISTYGVPQTYLTATSASTGDLSLPGGREITVIANPAMTDVGHAQTLADALFRRNTLRYGFTEGLDIFPGELITPGGTPIEPWAAYKLLGTLGVHYGAINEKNNSAVGETIQWVMGTTTYKDDDQSLQIASVDFQPRTLAAGFNLLNGGRPSYYNANG